jgi:hypothetical protein
MRFLDKAAITQPLLEQPQQQQKITVSLVEESKAFYRIMPIFALVVVYQLAYDPIFTLLPYPGDTMDRKIGASGALIPASSISFANTFGGERSGFFWGWGWWWSAAAARRALFSFFLWVATTKQPPQNPPPLPSPPPPPPPNDQTNQSSSPSPSTTSPSSP